MSNVQQSPFHRTVNIGSVGLNANLGGSVDQMNSTQVSPRTSEANSIKEYI